MTQEEVRNVIDAKAMEDLIVKLSNLGCDIFQKGFENGFNFGYKFAIDKVCKWLETNWEYSSQEISKKHQDWFIEMFKKAMEQ